MADKNFPVGTRIIMKKGLKDHPAGSKGIIIGENLEYTYTKIDGCEGCSTTRNKDINNGNYCDGIGGLGIATYLQIDTNRRRRAKLVDKGSYYELEYIN